jgi:hypothetical protein
MEYSIILNGVPLIFLMRFSRDMSGVDFISNLHLHNLYHCLFYVTTNFVVSVNHTWEECIVHIFSFVAVPAWAARRFGLASGKNPAPPPRPLSGGWDGALCMAIWG